MKQIDVRSAFGATLTGAPTQPLSLPEEGAVKRTLQDNWLTWRRDARTALEAYLGTDARFSDLAKLGDDLLTNLQRPETERIKVIVDEIMRSSHGQLNVVSVAPITKPHQRDLELKDIVEAYIETETRQLVQEVVLQRIEQKDISDRRQATTRNAGIEEAFEKITPKGWSRQSQRNHLWSAVKEQVIVHHLMNEARDQLRKEMDGSGGSSGNAAAATGGSWLNLSFGRSRSSLAPTEQQVRARAEKLWNEMDRRIKREEAREQLKTGLYKLAVWGLAGASIAVLLVAGPNVLSPMISLMELVPAGMLDRRFKYLKLDPLARLKENRTSKGQLVEEGLKVYWRALSAPGFQNRATILDFRGENNRMDRFVAEPLKDAIGEALKIEHGASLTGWSGHIFDQKIGLAAQRMKDFEKAWDRFTVAGLGIGGLAGANSLVSFL